MINNVEKSFRDKWENNLQCAFEETSCEGSELFTWILNHNGFSDSSQLSECLADKRGGFWMRVAATAV